jgi:hypothetical protein
MHNLTEHALVASAIHAAQKVWRMRFLRYRVIRPNQEMRIVFSALLRIVKGGRYLLVRNLHRPETFTPFGGVFKHRAESQSELDGWMFRPQDLGPAEDMQRDLRGHIPRRNLASVVSWFERHKGREEANECLRRELVEELKEINLELRVPAACPVVCVRVVDEGPARMPASPIRQFRRFEIYDLSFDDPKSETLVRRIMDEGESHKDLLIADSDEIMTGRGRDGRVIGSTACYLIRSKRVHGEDPFPVNLHGTGKTGV